mgnify:CR=1 FL=1
MLRVGLTGGIASGKSTAARLLAGLGAEVIDSDALAREVLAPGAPAVAEVAAAFGSDVLGADGAIERAVLGRIVFADPAARSRLEAITHPRIRGLTAQRFAAAPSNAVVVHDIPLLVELEMADRYHLVIVVGADEAERVRRLVIQRGMSSDDAWSRVGSQADDERRRAAADVWLDNTSGREELDKAVEALWRDRLVPFEANIRGRTPAGRPAELGLVSGDWAATGERLASRVRRAVGGAHQVEHVGFTAVPGLIAKDVVDLQLTVASFTEADRMGAALADCGFPSRPGPWFDADGGEKLLHGSSDPACFVNLHVRLVGSVGARSAVLLRDWMRADPAARAEYTALQLVLADRHVSTRDDAAGSEPWFVAVRPRMERWAVDTRWSMPAEPGPPPDQPGRATASW